MTREEWLHRLLDQLRPRFDAIAIGLPDEIGLSCGWPSERARSTRNRRIRECWRADCSGAGRPEIFISPTLADSIEVGHVLVHELIHAALPNAGHRAPFKRAATKLGLTGKMTATIPTDELRRQLEELVGEIGKPYPHALLDPTTNERVPSPTIEPGGRQPSPIPCEPESGPGDPPQPLLSLLKNRYIFDVKDDSFSREAPVRGAGAGSWPT